MKRPPGLWILLSAGVLWLSLQDVYGIRATALIFSKSTTSSTTEATSSSLPEENSNTETASNTSEDLQSANKTGVENSNSSEPVLTGNPQLDYIYDPNLPKELNGYNLSEYPFYERVPEEIDFKCDGLHDGFYASVPHKCQVYHHCLSGTRYDFLCANYTAFDQKIFNCHFVSEVDCQNSKQFWHRNDALYQAPSTTTTAPINLRAAIYTTAPPEVADSITLGVRRPTGVGSGGARRPVRPGSRRRRPYYDDEYYDDEYDLDEYYDERPRPRRKRPRPRPRPVYDEDYDSYDGDRYEIRRVNGRRRPYWRRNKDRRQPDVEDEEMDDRLSDEDLAEGRRRQKPTEDRRKHLPDEESEERSRPVRPKSTRKTNRRPIQDEYGDDEEPQSDDNHAYDQRPRKRPKESKNNEPVTSLDGRPIIKPATGTIYDRPRVAPKINLPVPKNAADKFAYKAIGSSKSAAATTTTTEAPLEEEYDIEEYEEPIRKPLRSNTRNSKPENKWEKPKSEESRTQSSVHRPRTKRPEPEDEERESKPKYSSSRSRYRPIPKKNPPLSEEYEDEDYADEIKEIETAKPSLRSEKKSVGTTTTTTTTPSTTTSTTTTTTEAAVVRKEPLMRIIKRPFLPSRGGNPYNSRGLQPLGLKAVDRPTSENESQESRIKDEDPEYVDDNRGKIEVPKDSSPLKPMFKPSPVIIKVPVRSKYIPPSAQASELIEPEPPRQQIYKSKNFPVSQTSPRPKVVEKNPLDLNEYDVTLNEALSPTLPNLPVRGFPTGFSSGSDYGYTTYSRPRYVLEPISNLPNQNYMFPNKRSQQRFEAVPQPQYSTINREYRQQQHSPTQAILSGY
ncbi:titin isoform X2 [Euwallacea fornicatus]|uniref:titin isoform X2 n=1 Tax=Euwallacea fornicatus TaxID=995702 RepID=UPI0033907040